MSKNTNKKIKANAEIAETLAKANVVPASVQAEPAHENWDRVIVPNGNAPEADPMDFERKGKGLGVDGVRYAKIDDNGNVMQVRVVEPEGRHWWTVKDAIDAGILGEDCGAWTGHFVRWDAQIARVELMEKLGIDIPTGVALSYAAGVKDKRAAEKARAEREEEIVKGGKDAYQLKASTSAGKRFDKIEERVKARKGK